MNSRELSVFLLETVQREEEEKDDIIRTAPANHRQGETET